MTARRTRRRMPWTFAILTIPARAAYLERLLASLAESVEPSAASVQVLYNARGPLPPDTVLDQLREAAGSLALDFAGNERDPTIPGGRNALLERCRSPLVAFLDDDITVHGDVLGTLESALAAHPLALVGLRSYENDGDRLHKPRESTPGHQEGAIRFMPVHGLLCAGYADVLHDLGGFNPRRRFWGEWTELNLRLWRHGLPTGYAMEGAYLRHWMSAPESPTRNRPGRDRDVLWGLICTALEYDAGVDTPGSDAFWELISTRYLPYAFGPDLAPAAVLAKAVELMPALAVEWRAIRRERSRASRHPFQFRPFHRIEPMDVALVRAWAEGELRGPRRRWSALPHRPNALQGSSRSARGVSHTTS